MEITDIIGKGKALEPPFKTNKYGTKVYDSNDYEVVHVNHLEMGGNVYEFYPELGIHICELLNERWNNQNPSKSRGLNPNPPKSVG